MYTDARSNTPVIRLGNQLRMQEEHHLKDVKQQRELWQASEKNKRDKWISEKTKLIKDQTVKGLEPEIQRMIAVIISIDIIIR
jgi:hypothetical protein